MVLLAHPRAESGRLARSASRPGLETAGTVARVSRFDGRTHVLAVRTDAGWSRSKRLPWTRETVEALRGDAREVLLSRHFRRARVSISWIPASADPSDADSASRPGR